MKEPIRCETWQEFLSFVEQSPANKVYWRGQYKKYPEWKLDSSFMRLFSRRDGNYYQMGEPRWDARYIEALLGAYLIRFKLAVKHSHPTINYQSDVEWWAIGRHYGLKSPLLDWTEDANIAVFFALIDYYIVPLESKPDRLPNEIAIYMLQDDDSFRHDANDTHDGLFVLTVPSQHPRIQAQKAVFTWLKSEDHFEIDNFLRTTGKHHLITPIHLSINAFQDAFSYLDEKEFRSTNLFPPVSSQDMEGAARDANAFVARKMMLQTWAFSYSKEDLDILGKL